jgi:DNA-binding NarL/FixJ family response regulator
MARLRYLPGTHTLELLPETELEAEALAMAARENEGGKPPVRLSPRQAQVLQALALGLTTRQIAGRYGLRPRTVAYHIHCLQQKLGAINRAQLVARAAALGLFAPGSEGEEV